MDSLHDKLEYIKQQLKRKADDIQNEVRNKELQGGKKIKSEVASWLEQANSFVDNGQSNIETEVAQEGGKVISSLSGWWSSHKQSKLDGMVERGERLLKQSEFPGGLLLDDSQHDGLQLVTEEMQGSAPSRVQAEVWSCFERGEMRVGIFGIGGVGKTSLAMHINNQIRNQKRLFDRVYYVTVSRETSVFKLQSDIAKAFGHRLDHQDEPKRAAELRKALAKREKSLLILDDVWEYITMEEVGVSVEGDGCKLLITARDRGVCRKMKCCPVQMNPLSPDESWDLFKKKIGNFETLPDDVKDTAALVARECGGLPLGIVTMARSMRGETSVHVWRDALKRLQNPCTSLPEMKNKVFRILRFSYDRLNEDKHRKCFLYCALYPEDYEIERDELISAFIEAGLLDGTNRKESIDEGHTLLNDLENASLLECVINEFDWRCVKMHDLVRDMAIEIIGSTGMLKAGKSLKEIPGKEEWINKDLQWVSLMYNLIEGIGDMNCPDCPNISVLLLQFSGLRSVSDSFFVRMIGLKVLNLSNTKVEVLPGSVSDLCNLNVLLLSWCSELHNVPSLAKLTKLRELDLESCDEMRKLPEGMEELTSLEHLNLMGTFIKGMQRGIFKKLLNLESFLSNERIIVPPDELMNLRHLEKLIGVHFDDVSVDLGFLNQLKTYSVSVGYINFQDDDEFLFPQDGINIYNTLFVKKVQLWCREECFLFPENVVIVEFSKCSFVGGSLLEAFPSLGDATKLHYCQLWACEGIEYIIPERWTKPLQGIQHLDLRILDEFGGLIREEVVHPYISFSGLRVLEIEECPKLKKLWMLNLDLPNLEEIDISECEQMEEIFATEKGGTINLPRLQSLTLTFLPELSSIWGNCEVFFPDLGFLEVRKCPKMKKIGMVSRNLPSLGKISISDCEQMEEIFAEEDEAGDKEIHWPKLEELDLDSLPELRSIWAGDNEIHLPKLKKLELCDIPELRSISRKTIVCNSLEVVSIKGTSGVKMKNCPISIPRLSVINNNGPLPVLTAYDKPRGWWDSLHWNDPATQSLFHQLPCLDYSWSFNRLCCMRYGNYIHVCI